MFIFCLRIKENGVNLFQIMLGGMHGTWAVTMKLLWISSQSPHRDRWCLSLALQAAWMEQTLTMGQILSANPTVTSYPQDPAHVQWKVLSSGIVFLSLRGIQPRKRSFPWRYCGRGICIWVKSTCLPQWTQDFTLTSLDFCSAQVFSQLWLIIYIKKRFNINLGYSWHKLPEVVLWWTR